MTLKRPLTDRDPMIDPVRDPLVDPVRQPIGAPYSTPSNAGSWVLGILAVLAIIGVVFWLSAGSHRMTTASNIAAPANTPTVTVPITPPPPVTQPATQPAPKSP